METIITDKLVFGGNCIAKINGNYRFQILIKNKLSQKGHDFISKFFGNNTSVDDERVDVLKELIESVKLLSPCAIFLLIAFICVGSKSG